MQLMARVARTRSNFFLFSFFIQNPVFPRSAPAPVCPQACAQGRYWHGVKDGYFGKSGFFQGIFFEFPGDFQREIPGRDKHLWKPGRTCFIPSLAFWGGNKLTDRLLALR